MSYEDHVRLVFNLDRVRWLKIDDQVQAVRIASGGLAPLGYYKALAGNDESKSVQMAGEALLSKMMGH